MRTADFAFEQSRTIRLLTILFLSKFAYAKLEETAAFFCFVYAGLAEVISFINLGNISVSSNVLLQNIKQTSFKITTIIQLHKLSQIPT